MKNKWWKNATFYQIYPASFKDDNNDGIGDINGIIGKLDYLKKLGIKVIWLSPVYQSPMVDNGYDISDYYAINPQFGNMHDFDNLLTEIHRRNMKLIMDLVVNHTSDQCQWFQEALKNPKSKYHNYYIFKKGKNGNPPNNWRSNFGYGSAWEKVKNSTDYYLHVFSKHQPDLNWENPELRQEIYKMINWWLDKGLDGFRIDAITFIKKDQDYASIEPDGPDGLGKVKYKTENRPGIDLFLKEMKEKCFDGRDIVTVGETSGLTYKDFKKYIGNNGFFSMVFDFHYADIDVESGSEWYKRTNWKISDLKELIDESQTAIQQIPGGWAANFLENHDQPRSINKYIKSIKYQNNGIGAKALALMLLFLRGCPFIFQGQELGIKNAKRSSISEFNDISSINNYQQMLKLGIKPEQALKYVNLRSRDNARTPFMWDTNTQQNYGFNLGHKPWIKMNEDNNNKTEYEENIDKNSVLNFYRKLIDFRQNPQNLELITGDYVVLTNIPDNLIAYGRGKTFQIYVNLSEKYTSIDIKDAEVIISNYDKIQKSHKTSTVVLKPYEAVLVRLNVGEK